VRVRSISAQTRVYRANRGPNYLPRGPSPREARIPHAVLPERRVVAQPRIALQGRDSTRTRLESSSRLPASRGYGRAEIPARTYGGSASQFLAQPRQYRSYEDRSRQYRSRDVPAGQGYRRPPENSVPAMRHPAPPSRAGRPEGNRQGYDRGISPRRQFNNSQVVPRERAAAAPFRSERQAAPRAPQMDGDARAVRRARRSDSSNDDNNKTDSRTRSRGRYGSGR